jgi:hypothetical protein
MSCYQMGRKKAVDGEDTEQLLLRPRKSFVKKLESAASNAKRFTNRNQVALEILETYLPFWEESERHREATVGVQFEQMRAVLASQPLGQTRKGTGNVLDAENVHEIQRGSKKAATKSERGRSKRKR